ncbi:MAG: response regulator [Anaerolineae bacterium]|nr:response regulator [Anaerolineae bacterium]NIN99791.1 response regulator [Anaerolineae bacterium]NIQ78667.1 response regulator [Anaerolineae bacterium]
MRKVLVVDDDPGIVKVVRAYLERDGFQVVVAYDGKKAMQIARHEKPDLVVLDLMLPEMDGWDVCRALHKESDVPIVMLTARVEESDKLVGLELGADDYVTKPFSPRELVARVRAVLRRVQGLPPEPERISRGDITVDISRHAVTVGDKPIELTPTEFDLLATLMGDPGRAFTRSQLLEQTQGYAYDGYERTIDVHIKNLRKKIEADPGNPQRIKTVYGVGYKFDE